MTVGWHSTMTSPSCTSHLLVGDNRPADRVVFWKSTQKNEIFMTVKICTDRTRPLLSLLLHNEYAYGWVCVVTCQLNQTPPDFCLYRLISAVHKGALCVCSARQALRTMSGLCDDHILLRRRSAVHFLIPRPSVTKVGAERWWRLLSRFSHSCWQHRSAAGPRKSFPALPWHFSLFVREWALEKF